MKAATIKRVPRESPEITVDPHLDEIFEGKVLFPEKLARANAFLAKHPLPEHLKKRKP